MDDQAESVLISLTRGSGTGGLSGVFEKSGMWYRPLLKFRRTDLIEFLEENDIPRLSDPMNEDDHYTRVSVRKHLKPLIIKQFGEGAWANIAHSAHRIFAAHSALEYEAEKRLKEVTYGSKKSWISVDASLLYRYFEDIRERVLLAAYRKAADALSHTHLTRKQMRHLKGLLDPKKEGSRLQLPSVSVLRTDRFLIFDGIPEDFFLVHDLEDGDIHLPDGCHIKVSKEILPGETATKRIAGRVEQLDASKLGSRVRIRPWREGDRFLPLGHHGEETKVKRALRRPARERIGPLWILESDERGDIAWVVGERISENHKIDESTRSLWTFTIQSGFSD
jgi:tRNA(Ile)-lysidine synthase